MLCCQAANIVADGTSSTPQCGLSACKGHSTKKSQIRCRQGAHGSWSWQDNPTLAVAKLLLSRIAQFANADTTTCLGSVAGMPTEQEAAGVHRPTTPSAVPKPP